MASSSSQHSCQRHSKKTTGCNASRACRCIRVFFGHLFSNLGLFAIVVGYVLLGALMFEHLEAEYELEQRGNIKRYRDDCLKELWQITERLNVLYEKNWTQLVHEQLRRFETNVVAAAKLEGYDGKDLLDSERQWSFSGALLYSVTVITTIGYGNLAPKTPAGKILTMIYAVFGVPLMLLCLSNLGQLLANTIQFAYSHVCCNRRKSRSSKKQQNRNSRRQTKHQLPTSPLHHQFDGSQICTHLPGISLTTTIPPPEQFKKKPPPPPPRLTPLKPKIMAHDVRQLLMECAEYSVAQSGEPGAQKFLRDLQQPETQDLGTEEEDLDPAPRYHNSFEPQLNTPSKQPLIQCSPPLSLPSTTMSSLQHHPSCSLDLAPPSPCSTTSNRSLDGNVGKTRVPVTLVLVILSGYICLGATVFAAWEDWSLLDGAYFCFITLSTIGFGDLVPGKSFQRAADPQGGQMQLVVCCAYLLMGLVLIATAFSLVQEEVIFKCRKAARWIGITSK
ncbi:potassium channel subfamily K member 18-like [Neocloeon triangulifer]|uniref:potassium channel subfamily K member 18-like n=1 Tax=Neocloeon triangulifer TaxID=2078957 RepID=UPI00286EE8D3|nr:potassium channel subfamily K member 18-like [Neocloeon triangulifer]